MARTHSSVRRRLYVEVDEDAVVQKPHVLLGGWDTWTPACAMGRRGVVSSGGEGPHHARRIMMHQASATENQTDFCVCLCVRDAGQ